MVRCVGFEGFSFSGVMGGNGGAAVVAQRCGALRGRSGRERGGNRASTGYSVWHNWTDQASYVRKGWEIMKQRIAQHYADYTREKGSSVATEWKKMAATMRAKGDGAHE